MDQAFLLSAKGRGFSFLHLERNKDRALFYERKRKFIFLLSAKGSENGKYVFFWAPKETKAPRGNFPSGVPTEKSFGGVFFPLGTPKLLTPPQRESEQEGNIRPLI